MYAGTKTGRKTLKAYKPSDKYTECSKYELALPGVHRRELRIPHPASFVHLASLAAQNFRRLLKKGAVSPFSKSRPVFATARNRALQPSLRPQNLARERAAARAGCAFLLKADVSHFYPSLYTHAVGWAIDPKMRQKKYWKDIKLLGKRVDQNLMDLDKKFSQGIPIGNDLSFLLAEIVLAAVDKTLKVEKDRCYRWFDDYEYSCSTEGEALAFREQLETELAKFRLRLNPRKTEILRLPSPSQE